MADTRCERTDLLISACSHCRGLDDDVCCESCYSTAGAR